MKIYFDVCCLNRPFDNHAQNKVRLESEAIITLLAHISDKKWSLIGSDIINYEISKIPDLERKKKVELLAKLKREHIFLTNKIIKRAFEIEN